MSEVLAQARKSFVDVKWPRLGPGHTMKVYCIGVHRTFVSWCWLCHVLLAWFEVGSIGKIVETMAVSHNLDRWIDGPADVAQGQEEGDEEEPIVKGRIIVGDAIVRLLTVVHESPNQPSEIRPRVEPLSSNLTFRAANGEEVCSGSADFTYDCVRIKAGSVGVAAALGTFVERSGAVLAATIVPLGEGMRQYRMLFKEAGLGSIHICRQVSTDNPHKFRGVIKTILAEEGNQIDGEAVEVNVADDLFHWWRRHTHGLPINHPDRADFMLDIQAMSNDLRNGVIKSTMLMADRMQMLVEKYSVVRKTGIIVGQISVFKIKQATIEISKATLQHRNAWA